MIPTLPKLMPKTLRNFLLESPATRELEDLALALGQAIRSVRASPQVRGGRCLREASERVTDRLSSGSRRMVSQ